MRNGTLDMQIEDKLEQLSPEELKQFIEEAHRTLEIKQKEKRSEVIRQIKELAASVGLDVDIRVKSKTAEAKPSRKRAKLPPKYRHPSDASITWTGRGQMPRWLRELVNQGHDREEFRISA